MGDIRTTTEYELDDLTGVYSRKAFYVHVKEILNSNKNDSFFICAVDVDKFKVINDLFGAVAGDGVLKYLADSIRNYIDDDKQCVVGRMHADNFMICLHMKEGVEEEFANYLDKKMEEYSLPFRIYVKCGIYHVHNLGIPVDIMCDRANMALVGIKGIYTSKYAIYDEKLRNQILQEQEINNEMLTALSEGQFVPFYQPKYNMDTGKIIGAEALVRWEHPQKGLVSPGIFIPVFEKNGFIANLDKYIWESVCADIHKWISADRGICPISVNVSRVELYDKNLPAILKGLVEKYNIPIGLLQLEITESAYTDSPEQMINAINNLKEEGFTILMDDFGSGYSSLNSLKDIPIDVLKLDLKFLYKSDGNKKADSILKSVVQMAKRLELSVIAEGVEEKAQVDFLKSVGCIKAQGYYYSKPVNRVEFEKMLQDKSNVLLTDDDFAEALISVDDIIGRLHTKDEIEWYRSAVILLKGKLYEYDIKRDTMILYDLAMDEESNELSKLEFVGLLSTEAYKSFTHPDDYAVAKKHFEEKQGGEIDVRLKTISKDNNYRWYRLTDRVVKDEDGNFSFIVGVLVDVSNEYRSLSLLEMMRVFEEPKGMQDTWTKAGQTILHGFNCDELLIEFPNIKSYYENPGIRYTKDESITLNEVPAYDEEKLLEISRAVKEDGMYVVPFDGQATRLQYVANIGDDYTTVINFVYNGKQRRIDETDLKQTEEVCSVFANAISNFVKDKKAKQYTDMYENAFSSSRVLIKEWNILRHSLMRSDAYVALDGKPRIVENTPESFLDSDYIHPDFMEEYKRVFTSIEAGNDEKLIVKLKDINGIYRWVYTDYKVIKDSSGKAVRAVGTGENVHAIFDSFREMRKSLIVNKTDMIPDVLTWVLADITEDRIIEASGDAIQHNLEDLRWSTLIEHMSNEHVVADDRDEYISRFSLERVKRQIEEGKQITGYRYRMRMDDGTFQWRDSNGDIYQSRADGHYKMFCYTRNVDMKMRCQGYATIPIERDSELRLYKKDCYANMISESMKKVPPENDVLLVLDMDRFGVIKQEFGDKYAAEIIGNVVSIIKSTIPANAILGQYYEDRYMIYIHEYESMEETYVLITALQKRLFNAFHAGGKDYILSASIGVAYTNEHPGASFDELYDVAEKSLGRAKSNLI